MRRERRRRGGDERRRRAPAAKPIVASPTISPKGHGSLPAMPTFSEMRTNVTYAVGAARATAGATSASAAKGTRSETRGGVAAAAETPTATAA